MPSIFPDTGDPWVDVIPAALPADFELSSEFARPVSQPAEPQDNQRATRYQESVIFWPRRTLDDGRIYEIGDINVPAGCLGILYGVETYLIGPPPDYKDYNTRADPMGWVHDFPGSPIQWHLQIETPQRYEVQAQSWPHGSLPGVPHPDLGGWAEMRYPWGYPSYRTRILIPEKRHLRLYFSMPYHVSTSERPSEIGGRLVALVTGWTDNPNAINLARSGW